MKKILKKIVKLNVLVLVMLLMVCVPHYTTKAATIQLNKKAIQLTTKQSYILKLSGTKQKPTWVTSNKNIAVVSSQGKITAKKPGTAVITAKIGSKRYSCKVLVNSKNAIIPLGKKNQVFLGRVYIETWQHPMMGIEKSYILKLAQPIKYRTEAGTVRRVSEIHLFSQKDYSKYVGKYVFVRGFTVTAQTQWYRRELCIFPDKFF